MTWYRGKQSGSLFRSCSVMDLLAIIVRPFSTTARLASHPRWLTGFLVLTAVSIGLTVARHPAHVTATLDRLPASVSPQVREAVATVLDRELWPRCTFLPVRLAAGWGTFALLLFYLCRSFIPALSASVVKFWSLEVHAEVTSVLSNLALVLYSLGSAGLARPGHPWHPLSVVVLFPPGDDFLVGTLLASINIFTLWYLVVLTAGLSVLCTISRLKALLIAFLAWAISQTFTLGAVKLIQDAMHFVL